MNLVLNTLQVSSCIPVSAEEITSYILHKNPHRQLDQDSDDEAAGDSAQGGGGGSSSQLLKSPTTSRGAGGGRDSSSRASPSPQRRAERAAMRSLRGHRQYIILDCRPRQEFDSCRLAPALHLDPDLLVSPEKLDAKLKEFMPLQVRLGQCVRGWKIEDLGQPRLTRSTERCSCLRDERKPQTLWDGLLSRFARSDFL